MSELFTGLKTVILGLFAWMVLLSIGWTIFCMFLRTAPGRLIYSIFKVMKLIVLILVKTFTQFYEATQTGTKSFSQFLEDYYTFIKDSPAKQNQKHNKKVVDFARVRGQRNTSRK
ncbi:hypothetical protein [Clostridium tertium]|uniref:hypothetical protein n=1 Tax=Clostridium tertium TaxID=1559 RepID=UPI0023B2A5D2|nr:hypothetical protein [Clostridium tertium]